MLGVALGGLGRYEDAVDALRQATTLERSDPLPQAHFGWALALAGHRSQARSVRDDLERRRHQTYVPGVLLAKVSVGMGEPEEALSWFEQAETERDALLVYCNVWFAFDPLRADPRFQPA